MRSSFLGIALALGTLVLSMQASYAQVFVAPTTAETSGVNTAIRNAARGYQSFIHQSQLPNLGQSVQITGMRLRLSSAGNGTIPATWPSQNLSFSDYTVQLSLPSAAIVSDGEIISTSTTFAQNQGAGVTTVRSGAMTIPTGSFANPGGTNPFGMTISFTTPYTYDPGAPLLYTIFHSGYAPSTEPQPFFAVTDFANGVADAVSFVGTANGSTTPSGFSSPYIVEFLYSAPSAAPEPGSIALLALGLAGAVVVRRRRK